MKIKEHYIDKKIKKRGIKMKQVEEFDITHRNYRQVITINVDWDSEKLMVYDDLNQLQCSLNYEKTVPKWFIDFLEYWDTEFLSLLPNMQLGESFNPEQYDIINIKRVY